MASVFEEKKQSLSSRVPNKKRIIRKKRIWNKNEEMVKSEHSQHQDDRDLEGML